LLRRRFATFRTIYLPTAGRLAEHGFELLPTARSPAEPELPGDSAASRKRSRQVLGLLDWRV
ncbi:MAG TPA: hypothetical protein VIJ82_00135, partial [Streptosporangiaceae bacterium]